MTEYHLYYVLNGLVNGGRGCPAHLAGGDGSVIQADGHYFVLDGEADGRGPYYCRDEAEDAAKRWHIQTWLFPTDGSTPRLSLSDVDDPTGDDNVGTITRKDEGVFFCELVGSYEVIDLSLSAPNHEMAALVFAATIHAHGTHC